MSAANTILLAKGPRDRALAHLANVAKALPQDKAFRVTFEEYKPHRSLSQNALLWSLYSQIIAKGGEAMQGWDKDDLHTFFLGNFHGWDKAKLFGETRLRPLGRSSNLSKQQFSDLVDSIVRFMAERGVVLDLPNEREWR